jgi:hypothetical protein
MGSNNDLGWIILLIAQIGLLALYYSGSMWLGVNWAALPWWVICAPALLISIPLIIIAIMALIVLIWG